MNHALTRRLVTIPTVFLAGTVAIVLAPAALPLALLLDLARGRFRFPLARLYAFGVIYAGMEMMLLIWAGILWVVCGFGLFVRTSWGLRLHRNSQSWWAARTFDLLRGLLGLRFSVEGLDAVGPGPLVVLSRHASLIDTLFPISVLAPTGLRLRYVLKQELKPDPLLDIFGHRLINHWADRSGANTAAELEALHALGSGMGEFDGVVIFPEGTRATAAKRERAAVKLSETHPPLGEIARRLNHTLPPRLGGTLALLSAAPEADVLVFTHFGLDELDGIAALVRAVPFRHPVHVGLWRIPRSEVPTDDEGRGEWLFGLWQKVDDWVASKAAS